RAGVAGGPGTAGLIGRERCFANNLVMRHGGDRMIICPPLPITTDEIDTLVERAHRAIDETYTRLKDEGLMQAAN
ncbi:MAG: aspartate aminotransferase family protein, partial [Boseongicola sp.]|nr:aspartate aminotransferase family protein [Boseongicola sp.]